MAEEYWVSLKEHELRQTIQFAQSSLDGLPEGLIAQRF
jgi:hypothetical protein